MLPVIFSVLPGTGRAQNRADTLQVVNSIDLYYKMAQTDSALRMVDLRLLIPGLVFDLRYATPDNFMRRELYPPSQKTSWLRLPAARALAKVQDTLAKLGLGIKIFDAYRPYRITRKMWELVHDERYVANPARGSGHNRGIAVDLTLIDLATRKEISMPTQFDNFSDSAHHDFRMLPAAVLAHRDLLRRLMLLYGFKALETEWWHYSFTDPADPRSFPVLDLSFGQLGQLKFR